VSLARLVLLETSIASCTSESMSSIFVVLKTFQGIEFLCAAIKVAVVDFLVVGC
jgi:hypothetical protein